VHERITAQEDMRARARERVFLSVSQCNPYKTTWSREKCDWAL